MKKKVQSIGRHVLLLKHLIIVSIYHIVYLNPIIVFPIHNNQPINVRWKNGRYLHRLYAKR